MTVLEGWEACGYRTDGTMEHPELHDNFVYAVTIQLERRTLVLHTEYRDGQGAGELTDLRFVGVVAHHFDDVVAPSILLHLEQVSVNRVIEEWRDLFAARKNYHWPIQFVDLDDLTRRLREESVTGIRIMSTCGLDGFVLASAAEHRRRERLAELDS